MDIPFFFALYNNSLALYRFSSDDAVALETMRFLMRRGIDELVDGILRQRSDERFHHTKLLI